MRYGPLQDLIDLLIQYPQTAGKAGASEGHEESIGALH
jgi:hypothetical protein